MRRLLLVLSVLLSMGWTMAVTRAQEPLTQTFTAADGSYSLLYPDGWIWTEEAGGASFDAVLVGGTAEIDPGAGAATAEAFLTGKLALYGMTASVTTLQIDGHDIARANPEGFALIVVAVPDQFVTLMFYGDTSALEANDATFLAIAASVQAPAAGGAVATTTESMPAATETLPPTEPPIATETAIVTRPVVVNGVSMIFFTAAGGDLYSASPDGSNAKQITQTEMNAYRPALSPDGTMLAYIANTSETSSGVSDVFVIPVGGGEPLRLSPQSSYGPGPVIWSADGTFLLYNANRAGGIDQKLYRVNADGSDERVVTFDGAEIFDDYILDGAPDGRILFIGFDGNGSRLFFSQADGSGLTRGPDVNTRFEGALVKWSPDGQSLLVSDTESLTLVNVDGSGSKTILDKSAGLLIYGIAWSPDGTQIAFTGFKLPDTTKALYTINADGSNLQPVNLGNLSLYADEITWGLVAGDGAPSEQPTQVPADAPTTEPGAAVATACTVAANGTANLRSGPGTTFARAGSLAGGVTQIVTGQTNGADGMVWWRLEDGNWVRSDVVTSSGDCASVLVVSP